MTLAPIRPGPRRSGPRPVPVALAALTTTVWAAFVPAALCVAVAVVIWVVEGRSTGPVLDAVRFAVDGWLLAHGVRLATPGGAVGLAPLVLTALVLRQLFRAGANTARGTGASTPGAAVRIAVTVAVCYTLLAVAAALFGTTGPVGVDPVRAGVVAGVVALVAAGLGAASERGIGAAAVACLPAVVRTGFLAGAAAVGVLAAAGAFTVGVRLAATADEVRAVFGAYPTGWVGALAFAALCVIYAPTLAVWAMAYLVGPGFAVGTGTTVSAANVALGPVPAFPPLAALPPDAANAYGSLLLGVPLLAGLLAGVLIASGRGRTARWRVTMGAALLAGPVAGVLTGLLAVAGSGPLGGGRLAEVGPSGWEVGAVFGVEVAVCALVGATAMRGVAAWSGRRAPGPTGGATVLPAGPDGPAQVVGESGRPDSGRAEPRGADPDGTDPDDPDQDCREPGDAGPGADDRAAAGPGADEPGDAEGPPP